jgi:hypothetical protein
MLANKEIMQNYLLRQTDFRFAKIRQMNYITFLIVAGCRIMKVNPRLETAEILW